MSEKQIAPVSGTVFDGEQPLANAKVLMLPLGDATAPSTAKWSYATTNRLGRFTMRLDSDSYGAHVGENLVLISTAHRARPSDKNHESESTIGARSRDASENSGQEGQSGEQSAAVDTDPALPEKQSDAVAADADKSKDARQGDAAEPEPAKSSSSPEEHETESRAETVPARFNRLSRMTYHVKPTGNSEIVFQIAAEVGETDDEAPPDEAPHGETTIVEHPSDDPPKTESPSR